MPEMASGGALSEAEFAALVDVLSLHPDRRAELIDLLREDHPVYDQRGTAATVRMRGWILLSLSRAELSDQALLFVLEELDTGRDAYLVAAASRALRAYPRPLAAFAPFVMRAIDSIRYRDEPVAFDHYGEYAFATTETTPLRELLTTLAWLGPEARAVLPEVDALRTRRGGLSKKLRAEVDRAWRIISASDRPVEPAASGCCCTLPSDLGNAQSWASEARCDAGAIGSTLFQDQNGDTITFEEFFHQRPTIVVFFYTRCDNPQKCSLTITKLARLQHLLGDEGLAEQIRTAAITYDPAFDLPERLRGYGQSRGVRMDSDHRMLRAVEGINPLRDHFRLGVNFIESLVNRHRVELYLLDRTGRIAASFERIHWDEREVLDRAVQLLNEPKRTGPPAQCFDPPAAAVRMFGTLASIGIAFFPKCPLCWAAYISALGITGLSPIAQSPWLRPALLALLMLNLLSVWVRGRATGRMVAFWLVFLGALVLGLSKSIPGLSESGAWCGVVLTLTGSLWNAAQSGAKVAAVNLRRPAGREV